MQLCRSRSRHLRPATPLRHRADPREDLSSRAVYLPVPHRRRSPRTPPSRTGRHPKPPHRSTTPTCSTAGRPPFQPSQWLSTSPAPGSPPAGSSSVRQAQGLIRPVPQQPFPDPFARLHLPLSPLPLSRSRSHDSPVSRRPVPPAWPFPPHPRLGGESESSR